MSPLPPVLITGYGAVSPLGLDAATSWQALLAGQGGLGRISHFDPTDYACQVAGEVQGFDPATTGLEAKDLKKVDRFIQLGLAAAREALSMAGLVEVKNWPEEKRQRIAVILGTGVGGLPAMEDATLTVRERGPRRVSPFFIPAMLPNLLAGQVSIMFGLMGANLCPVSACASGAHAIGWGKRLIQSGEADCVIVGGAEAAICPSSIAGFAAMRALGTSLNENPGQASRPFDAARDGFIMGEGAGVLVLESEAHATQRGATPLAKLAGFGQTADASHMTLADGRGSARAMRLALAEAGLEPATFAAQGAINAPATSTPAGDELEAAALAEVFGPAIPTSATKGATGHLLGAAGALEAVFSVQSLQHATLPPTLNLTENATPLTGIVTAVQPKPDLRHMLSNSFGFGGTNVALLFSKVN